MPRSVCGCGLANDFSTLIQAGRYCPVSTKAAEFREGIPSLAVTDEGTEEKAARENSGSNRSSHVPAFGRSGLIKSMNEWQRPSQVL